MTYRTLPLKLLDRIKREIETIPLREGKVILNIEMNSGRGGTLNSYRFRRIEEDEVRL